MAVELGMSDNSTLAVYWDMDGLNEGLTIEMRPAKAASSPPVETVDVSNRSEWTDYLGSSISSISPAWHIPNEGCPQMPWAYRFDFSNGRNFVIALGESQGAGFTYMPDSLLVLFSDSMAAEYRIPASRTSALGED
ncbi:hypothetical protein [Streptomyces sp. NPDC046821]|uniref:hypothetical protein n=1 Tax=Streptomyces sp. NPDC046821 TaxID=3154702 RepID=UPI0033C94C47